MKISKEVIIGLVVVVAMALLYWGINFLKGKDILRKDRVLYAVYHDVGGLQRTNHVTVKGLNVGRVRNIYFYGQHQPQVIVEILMNNTIGIPLNSTAKIVSSDLLGSKAIEIQLGSATAFAQTGDTLLSEVAETLKEEIDRQLMPIKNRAENIMATIDTMLLLLNSLFSEGNLENVSKTISHLTNSFENLSSTTGSIDTLISGQRTRMERILENLEYITLTFRRNEANFNEILNNLASISDTLAQVRFAETMYNVNKTAEELSAITEKINMGSGSLGLLINNDSLYLELENSARQLNLLLEDIRLNPRRYVKFSVF